MISAERLAQWKALLRKHRVTLLAAMGFVGMGCILLSELAVPATTESDTGTQAPTIAGESDADYEARLEQRLQEMLSQMEGVGTVEVMVTVSGSTEQVFAEEVKDSQGEHNTQTEHKPVITQQNGKETALVTKTQYPDIQGVAILCTGGSSAVIREQICKAVSTILGIPVSDIYVGAHTAG